MNLFIQEFKKLAGIFLSDPKPLAAGIIAPSLILICFSLVFGNFASIPIAVINNDTGPEGNILKEEVFAQISPLGNMAYFEERNSTLSDANKRLIQGELMGYIIIPEDFSRKINAGDNPQIDYYLRNYNTDIAKNLRLYLQEGIWAYYNRQFRDIRIQINEVNAKGQQVQWVYIIASGSIILAFILGGMFTYHYLFFKEKIKGTLCFYALSPSGLQLSFSARVVFALLISTVSGSVNCLLAYLLTGANIFAYTFTIFPALIMAALAYISMATLFTLMLKDFYAANLASMFGSILIWFISGGMQGSRPTDPVLKIIVAIFPNIYTQDIVNHFLFSMSYTVPEFNYLILGGMTLFWLVLAGTFYAWMLQQNKVK